MMFGVLEANKIDWLKTIIKNKRGRKITLKLKCQLHKDRKKHVT